MSPEAVPSFGDSNYGSTPWGSSSPLPKSHGDFNKRRLLLIYVHGFMGSGASFYKFPAHIHNSLMNVLSESHVIYTRIYPQYKCRGEMKSAIDQFSNWLSPHEADDLDVILLGHSIGGALAAGVSLLPASHGLGGKQKRHRILGLVNFDVPFLGLHPHVICSGIRSVFRRTNDEIENLPEMYRELDDLDATCYPIVTNPNFDPVFENDVRLSERGHLHSALHFFDKNRHNLPGSLWSGLVSYYTFPGYLNRLPHLRRQYKEMMQLEATESGTNRVRFVNYYTESNGNAKTKPNVGIKRNTEMNPSNASDENQTPKRSSASASRNIFARLTRNQHSSYTAQTNSKSNPDLPDSTSEYSTVGSSSRNSTSNSTVEDTVSHLNGHTSDNSSINKYQSLAPNKKTRTFVLKPSHHWKDGDDHLWKAVRVEGTDEVEAHQSMFLPNSDMYERLVGETVTMIERWIQDDISARVAVQRIDHGSMISRSSGFSDDVN